MSEFEYMEVIATLRDRVIEARITEQRCTDELTMAMRNALENGSSIEALSNETGLAPESITRYVESVDLAEML